MKQRINIDPADYPLPGNKLSPKEQYQAIRADEEMAERNVRGSNLAAATRLRRDSDKGRYAVPGYGDQGQFLMSAGNEEEEERPAPPKRDFRRPFAKGGSVKSNASSRADGCAQRGKTKGRFV